MSKIKVFLGGYINYTNAQNLNCRDVARFLDKDRFDVFTLSLYSGNLSKIDINGVRVFNCFYPYRISVYFGYLWGIWNADVVYLPKNECLRFNSVLLKILNKQCFMSIEGVYNDEYISFAKKRKINPFARILSYSYADRLYPITRFVGEFMHHKYDLKIEDEILYLGCDVSFFKNNKEISELGDILMIGNALKEKGVDEYLYLANKFKDLTFHIVGAGHDLDDKEELFLKYSNVIYHGVLSQSELNQLFLQVDLHILLSKTEGFPKVVIEAAAARIPSILYGHYGASEWLLNGQDCFIIDNINQVVDKLQFLQENPKELKKLSKNANHSSKQFSWDKQIKHWEKILIKESKK